MVRSTSEGSHVDGEMPFSRPSRRLRLLFYRVVTLHGCRRSAGGVVTESTHPCNDRRPFMGHVLPPCDSGQQMLQFGGKGCPHALVSRLRRCLSGADPAACILARTMSTLLEQCSLSIASSPKCLSCHIFRAFMYRQECFQPSLAYLTCNVVVFVTREKLVCSRRALLTARCASRVIVSCGCVEESEDEPVVAFCGGCRCPGKRLSCARLHRHRSGA